MRTVVAVDSSFWGLRALDWASEHAALSCTDLEVCAALADGRPDPVVDEHVAAIRRLMPSRAIPVLPTIDPVTALIAESKCADLVVLGRRGRDHRGLGLGAAVRPVVVRSACDVVVVGGVDGAVQGTNRRVTAVLSESASVAPVLTAARLAAARRARLRLLWHRRPVGRGRVRHDTVDHALRHDATGLARELVPDLDVDVATGAPIEVLARLRDTDLVVVDARAGLDAVARAALYHARSPVVLARS